LFCAYSIALIGIAVSQEDAHFSKLFCLLYVLFCLRDQFLIWFIMGIVICYILLLSYYTFYHFGIFLRSYIQGRVFGCRFGLIDLLWSKIVRVITIPLYMHKTQF